MTVSLLCAACRKTQRCGNVVTGDAPLCGACGGKLTLPTPKVFRCLACGVASKPALLDLAAARPCPKCHAPLQVTPDAEATPTHGPTSVATIVVDGFGSNASAGPISAVTIAMDGFGSDPAAASGGPDPFDPARAEFISGNAVTVGTQARATGAPARGGLKAGKFGRYEIIRELARGGMGIVYQARDPALKRVVALKVMIAGEGADDNSIRRFIREARAASALRHANIVTVHDAGEIDGQHFFTMDFIEGRELAAILAKDLEPLDQMVGWVHDVCLALHYAHDKGIIHRDLKPANIMVDRERRPLVMDFGLARDQGAQSLQSLSGSVCGTPAYMSPEQAQGKVHDLDRRTDIYSMGVILYELATHTKPFNGNTLFDTMRAVVNDDPRPPVAIEPQLGNDLNTIILKCLEKPPDKRYATMRELADDLGRYLKHEPIAARPISALERIVRRLKREPKLVAIAIAAPLACLLGLMAATTLMGDGFLARMETEIRSGDPARMTSAVTSISGQLGEHRFARAKDHQRALALVRSVLGKSAPEAEDKAIAALEAERDGAAVPALLTLGCDRAQPEELRIHAFATVRVLVEVIADKAATSRALSAALGRTGEGAEVVAASGAALHALDDSAALAALLPIANDTKQQSAVRIAAIAVLSEDLRLHSPAMPALLALQGDHDRAVAEAADAALSGARNRLSVLTIYGLDEKVGKTTEELAKMHRAVSDSQRAMEAELAADDDAPVKPVKSPVAVIADRLRAKDPAERCAAAFDLGQLHDAAAIAPLIAAIVDGDGTVRRSAGRALVKLSPLGSVPSAPLIAALAKSDARVREHTAILAGELEAREAVPALCEALRAEKDGSAAEAMAEALGRIGDVRALPALRDGCARPGDLALVCVASLRAHKAFAGEALPHLVNALASTSRSVREAAAAALHDATGQDFAGDAEKWGSWVEQHKK